MSNRTRQRVNRTDSRRTEYDRIEGQMEIDECIEVAETGSDGKPPASCATCPHSEFWYLTERCCRGAEVDDG